MNDSTLPIVANSFDGSSSALEDFHQNLKNGSPPNVFPPEVEGEDMAAYQSHHWATILALCCVYGVLSLTATLGNGMLIWILVTGRRMDTVVNLYIRNLAIADIIIAIFCIPFQFQAALLQKWHLPSFMCKMCPFLQNLSFNASIYTLIAIAFDRYRGIVWPLKGTYSKSKAKIFIGLIWIISISLALPNLAAFEVQPIKGSDDFGCMINTNLISANAWMVYEFTMVWMQYVIPEILISIVYARIAYVLWFSPTPGQAYDRREIVIEANKRKVTKMLLIVVVLFGICWLPFQIFNLLMSLDVPLNFHGVNYVWMSSHILAMSNSCFNPFIYGIFNEKFRCEFNRKISCLTGRTLTDASPTNYIRTFKGKTEIVAHGSRMDNQPKNGYKKTCRANKASKKSPKTEKTFLAAGKMESDSDEIYDRGMRVAPAGVANGKEQSTPGAATVNMEVNHRFSSSAEIDPRGQGDNISDSSSGMICENIRRSNNSTTQTPTSGPQQLLEPSTRLMIKQQQQNVVKCAKNSNHLKPGPYFRPRSSLH